MFDNPSKISDFNYVYVNDKLVNMDTGTFPDQNIEKEISFILTDQGNRFIGSIKLTMMLQEIQFIGNQLNEFRELKLTNSDRHIQELMIQGGFDEILLPLDNNGVGPFNNIFVSKNWQTAQKLMLIIQGSGAVR